MTFAKRHLVALMLTGVFALWLGQAVAQQGEAWPTPGGGHVPSEVLNCLNGSSQAVPASSTNPCPMTATPGTANLVSGTTSAMTGITSTQVVAAVATKKLYITHISCVNSHATVGTFVTVQDGSGGTALATLAAAAVFGGDEQTSVLPLFSTTAGNGLFVADVTTGASVICNASGFSG